MVTENLGLTATAGEDLGQARGTIQNAWADDVRASGAAGPPGLENTPAALDPALWFLGKWGCAFCEAQGMRVPGCWRVLWLPPLAFPDAVAYLTNRQQQRCLSSAQNKAQTARNVPGSTDRLGA